LRHGPHGEPNKVPVVEVRLHSRGQLATEQHYFIEQTLEQGCAKGLNSRRSNEKTRMAGMRGEDVGGDALRVWPALDESREALRDKGFGGSKVSKAQELPILVGGPTPENGLL
jgi:hypothetical protein